VAMATGVPGSEDTGGNHPFGDGRFCTRRPLSTLSSIVNIRHRLGSLGACCAMAAMVGCASANRRVSEASLHEENVNHNGGQFLERVLKMGDAGGSAVLPGNQLANTPLAEFSQNTNLEQIEFQNPSLDTNGPVTLDEWQRFIPSAGPKENFSALDVNNDRNINATEFLTQTPKRFKRFRFFADQAKTNNEYSSRGEEEFQQKGWQLFSIRF
jgi:hypothetical protein